MATNFLSTEQDKTIRRQTLVSAVVFTCLVSIVAAIGAGASYRAVKNGHDLLSEVGRLPVIADMRQLVFGPVASAQNGQSDPNRFNVLILGIGGEGHDGPQLTDTIMLASVDVKANKLALLSIPRDLAYPLDGNRFEKINAVNAYAEQQYPGEGAKRTADDFSRLLAAPIEHYVRIDFQGFADLVDAVGGVDINVEHSFTDPLYPTDNFGWKTVSFKKGEQHMDGRTALIYTRSRHGNNGEGTDFARSRRQQLIILSLREKLLTLGTLADPRRLAGIYEAVNRNVQTDLSVWDLLKLAPLARDIKREDVTLHALTDRQDGELTADLVNGSYLLFPRQADWSEIRQLAQNPFEPKATTTADEQTVKPEVDQAIHLEIKNGTFRTGFASQVAARLEQEGYTINAFGNAASRGYVQTTLFDLTNGRKPAELSRLQQRLNATLSLSNVNDAPTASGRTIQGEGTTPERIQAINTDFLVILGEDGYSLLDE